MLLTSDAGKHFITKDEWFSSLGLKLIAFGLLLALITSLCLVNVSAVSIVDDEQFSANVECALDMETWDSGKLNDFGSHNLDFTVNNWGGISNSSSGHYGYAVELNGSSTSYLKRSDTTSSPWDVTEMTVSFWLYAHDTTTRGVVGKSASWYSYFSSTAGRCYLQLYSGSWITSVYCTVTANEWHHVVFSCNPSNITTYLDGSMIGRKTTSWTAIQANNNQVEIGYSYTDRYDGMIDEFIFLSRGLDSDSEAVDLYNAVVNETEVNPPPEITSSPSGSVAVHVAYSYDANADQTVTWSLSTNATWLSIVSGTGVVSGTPLSIHADYWVNVSCSNVNGSDYQNYSLDVVAGAAPVLSGSPPVVGYLSVSYSYDFGADQVVVFSLVSNASFLEITSGAGVLSGVPDEIHFGFYVNVTITNENGTDWYNFSLEIKGGSAPLITSEPILVVYLNVSEAPEAYYWYEVICSQDGVSWSVLSNLSFIDINGTTGLIEAHIPNNTSLVGTYWINVSAENDNGVATQNYTLQIGYSYNVFDQLIIPFLFLVFCIIFSFAGLYFKIGLIPLVAFLITLLGSIVMLEDFGDLYFIPAGFILIQAVLTVITFARK